MAGRGDTRKGYAGFRVAIQMYPPSGKDDIFRPAVQLPRSDPREAMGAVWSAASCTAERVEAANRLE